MICSNCSAVFDDNMMFCPNCGAAVNNRNAADNSSYINNGTYANNNGYQQPDSYTQSAYGSPAYYQSPQPEKNPTIWQYVGWMLIGSVFGPISIIISIVFACMSENKPRATYFRAHLIIIAISLVLSMIAFIAIAIVGFSFADVITDSSFEIYNDFMQIASLVG